MRSILLAVVFILGSMAENGFEDLRNFPEMRKLLPIMKVLEKEREVRSNVIFGL